MDVKEIRKALKVLEGEWFATHCRGNEEDVSEEHVWTLSQDPNYLGWENDADQNGYGLPMETAKAFANLPESCRFLLSEIEGLQNTIAQMQDAEQMIYECRMKGGDAVRHLLDNLLAENKQLKTGVERLEKENAALREVVENIENDDGRIPKTIWDMRNKALEKIKEE